jgi:hypothetical protein
MTEASNPARVALIIENTVELNGRQVESNQKVYLFSNVEAAEKFADKLMEIPQGGHSDNIVRFSIVDYVVDASDNAEPVLLHTAYYDHGDSPEDGQRVLEDIDVLTVEEIDDFRTKGIKPNIVKAFDNPDLLEPSESEKEDDSAGARFELVGFNLFQDFPETDFFLSFDSNITEKLYEKFGDPMLKAGEASESSYEDKESGVRPEDVQRRQDFVNFAEFLKAEPSETA